MPKQTGILSIKGKIDEMSFYHDRRTGDIVRRAGGPSRMQIKTKKSFAPIRKNNNEFARASSNGKIIRRAFSALIDICGDNSMNTRLVSHVQTILKQDKLHRHGNRTLNETTLPLFGNFEINKRTTAGSFFKLPVRVRKKNNKLFAEAKLWIPEKLPVYYSTHWKVISVFASIDFGKEKFTSHLSESPLKPIEKGNHLINLSHPVPSKGYFFHGLCIHFFQETTGQICPLRNKDLNTAFIYYTG